MKFIKYIFCIHLFLLLGIATSSAQLNEGFEGNFPPAGWVVYDNGIGLNNAWERGIFKHNTGEAHAYVRQSIALDGTEAAEDWLVTPKLQPASGSNTLTFFATDNSIPNYGSIYTIRVSTTSQFDRNSFTTEATYLESDFTTDIYQQFSVDLSAYDGQDIYVAFVMTNNRGDSFFLDDVGGPAIAPSDVQASCDAVLQTPTPEATGVPIESNLQWLPASGDPFGYKVQIGTTSGGNEFLMQTDVGAVLVYKTAMDFAYNTTYYVRVLPYNSLGDAIPELCAEYSFTTREDPNITLDCAGAGTPVSKTLCYTANEDLAFTIASNNGSQVELTFNAGTLENERDEIQIYDGVDATGTLLNPDLLSGNAGDLTGISYVSSTGSLYLELETNNENSCGDGNQTAINYTASCVACAPAVAVATVGDCSAANSEFFIDVNISDLGSGTVTIANGATDLETVNTTGTTTVGPFSYGTVVLTLKNNSDANCNINLPAIMVEGCAPDNNACVDAPALTAATDNTCGSVMSGTLAFATISNEDGICSTESVDAWYSFTPDATGDYIFNITDAVGLNSIAVYEGDCANGLLLLNDNCQNEGYARVNLTENITYLVQVFTDDVEQVGAFDLCVFAAPLPPNNDLCGNAIELTNDLTDIDVTFATNNDATNCNGNQTGQGVWYRLDGFNGTFDLSVLPEEWDAAIQLWSGADCQNLTCELSTDDGVTGDAENVSQFTTTADKTYYLYISAFAENEVPSAFDLNYAPTVTLGVELFAFQAITTDNTNILTWQNANEIDVVDYILERSENGQDDWGEIGELKALNTANGKYEWVDENPLTIGYYRLRIIKADGNEDISTTIVVERDQVRDIKVFPIPASQNVQVEFYSTQVQEVRLLLTDIVGKTIQQHRLQTAIGRNTGSFNLDSLDHGVYLLTLKDEQRSLTTRVIKQ